MSRVAEAPLPLAATPKASGAKNGDSAPANRHIEYRCTLILGFVTSLSPLLIAMRATVLICLVAFSGGGVQAGGSTISIYQSTSNVPPLAEGFSEGACVIPNTARKLDTKWLVRQSTFYVPIASQFTFRLYAESFLSRAGVSEQDVRSMCLTIDFFPDGPGVNLTNTGFDLREFKNTCPVVWRGQFTCLPVGGSPGTNPARARSTDNYVVSVDNQSYMLVVRCVDGFFRDYMLLTTRPVVSPELYHTVVSTIKDLGFDERKIQMLTYDNCLRTDRFVTAVNLHQPQHHHHHRPRGESDREITIQAGGPDGLHVSTGSGGRVPVSNLRPSYGGSGGGGGGRRISISHHEGRGEPQLVVGGGGGRGNSKVEEVEAFYAIIP